MEGSRYGFHSANSENQRGRDDVHTPAAISVSLHSCGGSVAPTSHRGSVAPTSRGWSVAPTSRRGSPTSRGGSIALTSRGGSVAPTSRGGSVAPTSRGGSVAPASCGGSVAPTSRGGSVPISRRGSTAPSSCAVSSLSFHSGSVHGAPMMQPLNLANCSSTYSCTDHNRHPAAKHIFHFTQLRCASSSLTI